VLRERLSEERIAWSIMPLGRSSDYTFGHALERDTAAVVTANGGKVLGGVKHPINTSDFSSFLLQAQASKAKVIGLANAGGDTTNAIKQAAEFGIAAGGQKLAALLLFINDVHSLGLKTAQGLSFTESFYWDMNDQTRGLVEAVCDAVEGRRNALHDGGGRIFRRAALSQDAGSPGR